uniref:AB hydrolase-1 domain-containing protein n=1 Tax=Steinernema glaseri TaxID=37863 RepID=A0A1I7Y704_9BILA
MEIIERRPPTMNIKKEFKKDGVLYVEGNFITPLKFEAIGEIVRPEVATASWRGIFPTNRREGLVIHLAGTGDHSFFRREWGFADGLLKQGISSILLENPFYGSRKPSDQFRSSLSNVSDLFVMGASLIAECNFILSWARSQGFGPLAVSGVSMGGHMASLAASNCPVPVALVPCLSWSTAAPVFTEGALSGGVQWEILERELMKPEFRNAIRAIPNCTWLEQAAEDNKIYKMGETKQLMWILMDEFTSLAKYPTPKDTSLITSIFAEEDAYVLRRGRSREVPSLKDLWPNAKFVSLPNVGHVEGYLRHHDIFRQAIAEMLETKKSRVISSST